MIGKMARKMARTLKMALMMALLMAGSAFAQEPLIDSVCLVTDVGRVDDGTFNQGGYEGMLAAAEDFGLKTTFIETISQVDYRINMQTCIDAGHDAIITMGFLIADATLAAAQANPDVYFIGVDHFYSEAPANLVGLQFREDQAGFLAGALAGLMTESEVVAGVYGIDIPPVLRFRCGFEQGVAHSNAPAQALGVHVPSFIDPATGAETALQFIAEGADVILGAGGTTGSGAIRAAAAENVYVIGVDKDEYLTTFGGGESPGAEYLITSALKRVDRGVYLSLQALAQGDATSFHGRDGVRVLDAASGGIGLAPPHASDVPDEALAQVDAIFAALQGGSLGTGCDPVTGARLTEGTAPQVRVLAARLRLRSGPGTDHEILDVVIRGNSYPARGRNADGSWIAIDVGGTTGWVSADWVEVSPAPGDLMVVDAMMLAQEDAVADSMAVMEEEPVAAQAASPTELETAPAPLQESASTEPLTGPVCASEAGATLVTTDEGLSAWVYSPGPGDPPVETVDFSC